MTEFFFGFMVGLIVLFLIVCADVKHMRKERDAAILRNAQAEHQLNAALVTLHTVNNQLLQIEKVFECILN